MPVVCPRFDFFDVCKLHPLGALGSPKPVFVYQMAHTQDAQSDGIDTILKLIVFALQLVLQSDADVSHSSVHQRS